MTGRVFRRVSVNDMRPGQLWTSTRGTKLYYLVIDIEILPHSAMQLGLIAVLLATSGETNTSPGSVVGGARIIRRKKLEHVRLVAGMGDKD